MSRASGLMCHWTKRVATALEQTLAKEESPMTTAMTVPAAAARDIARCIGGTAGAKARESKASIGSAVWLNFLNLVCWHLRSCRSARCHVRDAARQLRDGSPSSSRCWPDACTLQTAAAPGRSPLQGRRALGKTPKGAATAPTKAGEALDAAAVFSGCCGIASGSRLGVRNGRILAVSGMRRGSVCCALPRRACCSSETTLIEACCTCAQWG